MYFYLGEEETLIKDYNKGPNNVIIKVLSEKFNIEINIQEFDYNNEL